MKTVFAKKLGGAPSQGNEYQNCVHAVLVAIAQLNPNKGNVISETAISIVLRTNDDRATIREAVHDAFQLLVDLDFASPLFVRGRISRLYRFHESFGPADVDGVWCGSDLPDKGLRQEEDRAEHHRVCFV